MLKSNFKHSLGSMCVAAALLLSACATSSTGSQTVAPEQTGAQKLESMARVIVSRDYAAPVLFKANIEFNGQRLGALRNSQYMEVYVPPGDYKLAAKFSMARGTTYNFKAIAGESYGWEFESPVVPTYILLPEFTQYSPETHPEKYTEMTKIDSKTYDAAK